MRAILASRPRLTTATVLAWHGDSNTDIGAFVTPGLEWAAIAANIIDPTAEYHNEAISGHTIEQMVDDAPTLVDVHRTATARVNIAIVMGGTNGGLLDSYTKYQQMMQFVADRKAALFDYIFVLPYLRNGDLSTDAGKQGEGRRQLYRSYLQSSPGNGRDFIVVDHDSVPELQDPTNATYFFASPDLTHMKAPAHAALGTFAGNFILSVIS
ncbi:MAG: SGNH/GDSL hydrolase family protein [Polyangiaceae bacterium]|nr:SGNH/GDSL hydrolase family protein [Polyangiaceae bacterium]